MKKFINIYLFVIIIFISFYALDAKKNNKTYFNSIGIEFVYIPAGHFIMGAPDNEGSEEEHPQHKVIISKGFYLSKYEITQAQWKTIMKNNPSKFSGNNRPVESVTWDDIQIFVKKLNKKEKTIKYFLPTEAQWEYACRAGSTTKYYFGNDSKLLDDYAWYRDNSGLTTHPVGLKKPNVWGLYDMHGNVNEWVADRYNSKYYSKSPIKNPKGSKNGTYRVSRGGGWAVFSNYQYSFDRFSYTTNWGFSDAGFRLLMLAE